MTAVHALDWAISFVVWKGNVYEVHTDEFLDEHDIGKKIGQVTTRPSQITGEFYANASNTFPVGTTYFKIDQIDTAEAIAVKDGEKWLKATYSYKAPAHILNLVIHPAFFVGIIIVISAIIAYIPYKNKQM